MGIGFAVAALAGLVFGLQLLRSEQEVPTPDTSAAPLTPAANAPAEGEKLSFNRDIRPILSEKCFACHGPDAAVSDKMGGFRLDLRETAVKPAQSGETPIVPGDAEASEIIHRIEHDNPNLVMPKPESNLEVTDRELALLKRWINEGAEYEGHWAYQPPVKPTPPTPAHEDWVRNDIDRFIARQMEKAGLSPSEPADRETLIRRVSLDLIGLPPTPQQIDAFVNDPAPDAYEKLVDRLLASEHFGERLAIIWLDASRYADTNGFHHDNIRTAWPWRQWVIQAFNDNKPYDQFVIEQLAGDLLPNATRDQILASGFCRMHNINDEGGALDEEYIVEAVADRIETVATVFMGQTYTCARCHDHKYDPTTQEDYFATWAYFNSVDQEQGVYPNNFQQARAYPPRMMYRTDEDTEQLETLTAQRDRLIEEADAGVKKLDALHKTLNAQDAVAWASPELTQAKAKGATLTPQPDGSALASGKNPRHDTFTLRYRTDQPELRVIRLDALRDPSLPNGGLGRAENANAVLTHIQIKAVSVANPKQSRDLELAYAHADHEQGEGDYDIDNALRPDNNGWAVDGHRKDGDRRVTLLAAEPFGYEGGTELVVTLDFKSQYGQHTLGRVRVDAGTPSPGVLSDQVIEQLETRQQINALTREIDQIEARGVPVLIMKEADEPTPSYILQRGAYDKPITDRAIPRRPPSFLDLPMPEGAPNNRLGFAQWLTQDEHPLTARVHVNRLWNMVFGTGIVKTVEDFGSQAEWPSHPALLDYLAVDFVESDWDQKALLKKIVMSATYRQKATRTPAAAEVDPTNRLLSHFPRQRLAGELIRDQALFVAGLLDDTIGGPSVKPYQPEGLWNEVAIGGTNTGRFKRGGIDELYRRSMYTFWKKTSPPPQMSIFNAPTREFCVVSRDRTNTPLQVLTLWNDEQFLEAARVLGQRTLSEAEKDDARLTLIYRRCTGQTPDEQVLSVLRQTLDYYRQRYSAAPEDAQALLQQGEYPLPDDHDPAELASWMMVASSVLSLDDTIVRD